jgi:hypothetical protein
MGSNRIRSSCVILGTVASVELSKEAQDLDLDQATLISNGTLRVGTHHIPTISLSSNITMFHVRGLDSVNVCILSNEINYRPKLKLSWLEGQFDVNVLFREMCRIKEYAYLISLVSYTRLVQFSFPELEACMSEIYMSQLAGIVWVFTRSCGA